MFWLEVCVSRLSARLLVRQAGRRKKGQARSRSRQDLRLVRLNRPDSLKLCGTGIALPAGRSSLNSVSRVSNIYAFFHVTFGLRSSYFVYSFICFLRSPSQINNENCSEQVQSNFEHFWRRRCAHHRRAHLFVICQQHSIHYCTAPWQSSLRLPHVFNQPPLLLSSRATCSSSINVTNLS